LKAAREKLGLTQVEFARALGVQVSRLQKWERAASIPRFTIREMRRFYRLNPEVFHAMLMGNVSTLRPSSASFRRAQGTPPMRRAGDVEADEEQDQAGETAA
jgi:DNA-binding transcriptional regulator YiaG